MQVDGLDRKICWFFSENMFQNGVIRIVSSD